MKANIKLELKSQTPARLHLLLFHVAESLDGNANFPTPPVTPAELLALVSTYGNAITEATEGSLLARKVRDSITEQVRATLRHTADYVRMVAQGAPVILASSGFSLAKGPSAPSVMEAPRMRPAIMTGRAGEVKLRWTGVRNRRTYHIYMSEGDPSLPDTTWSMTGVTGKITHRVKGLVPYKPYWFSICAVGALGEGTRSDPIPGRAA